MEYLFTDSFSNGSRQIQGRLLLSNTPNVWQHFENILFDQLLSADVKVRTRGLNASILLSTFNQICGHYNINKADFTDACQITHHPNEL